MEQALARVPALETAGVKQLINGPESFTPDGNFILGEAPEVQGFYVGCGFNAFGIASAGGAGRALAEWIVAGEPPMDLWPVDIRRFGLPHGDDGWVRARTLELYGKHYTIAWPAEEHRSGRPLRRSPLYARLAERGAVFGEKLGWERANWFARPGQDEPRDIYSFGRPNWFEAVGEEHRACRERVALFDASSFAKFLLVGHDAEAALSLDLRQRRQPPARPRRLHPDAERAGRHRVRPHRDPPRSGRLLHRHRHRLRHPRLCLDRAPPAGARRCAPARRDLGLRGAALMGPLARDLLARVTADDVSNAASVRPLAHDRHRRRAGAGAARHLCRRARLGAACAERAGADRLRRPGGRGRGSRPRPCRLPRHRVAAPGEGLPGLGRRHRPRPHAARGGPGLRASSSRRSSRSSAAKRSSGSARKG